MDIDRKTAGFKRRTRVAEARERFLGSLSPTDRTESVALADADGRVLAGTVAAPRSVPHYERATVDGYAVRAEDTAGASDRSPATVRLGDEVAPDTTVRVDVGRELPEGADAVVPLERTEQATADEVAVLDAVAARENVAAVGEDVSAGDPLYDPGHRLRPSDLGLLRSVGLSSVAVVERPRVSVVPTGGELVQADPEPGEVIETNGQTISQYVRRWGGTPTQRDVVPDDVDALRNAIRRETDYDVVVTAGGSSVGEDDLVPDVVDGLGELLVHGVAIQPGHSVAIGQVDETPVLVLPGSPVACIVSAVQFLRPALARLCQRTAAEHPTVTARLTRKLPSEPGLRTFARVELGTDGEERTATPTRAEGPGILSSVALADGWVTVPEPREGFDAGTTVAVEDWEWSA